MGDDDQEIDLGNEGLSFQEIALRQFSECAKCLSVELRGGYHFYSKEGDSGKEIYVPDTREIASNSIFTFALLCLPKFNKDMKKKYDTFKGQLTKLSKKFIKDTSVEETVVLCSDHYETEPDRMLLEEFKISKLNLHIKLFADLSQFAHDKNYFGIGGGTF